MLINFSNFLNREIFIDFFPEKLPLFFGRRQCRFSFHKSDKRIAIECENKQNLASYPNLGAIKKAKTVDVINSWRWTLMMNNKTNYIMKCSEWFIQTSLGSRYRHKSITRKHTFFLSLATGVPTTNLSFASVTPTKNSFDFVPTYFAQKNDYGCCPTVPNQSRYRKLLYVRIVGF